MLPGTSTALACAKDDYFATLTFISGNALRRRMAYFRFSHRYQKLMSSVELYLYSSLVSLLGTKAKDRSDVEIRTKPSGDGSICPGCHQIAHAPRPSDNYLCCLPGQSASDCG